MKPASYVLKRIFDLWITLIALVPLLPVFGIIALLIRVSSPGPVLFRQTRVGLNGEDFTFLKFRTMSVLKGADQGLFTPGNQSRVTRIGSLLRSSKLDELPQLFNVIKGDMSLVGPRPEVRIWVQAFPEQWAFLHTVKPGIFDPAVICYRNEEQILAQADDPEKLYREHILPSKLRLNEQYVRSQSFGTDISILIRGALSVFFVRTS